MMEIIDFIKHNNVKVNDHFDEIKYKTNRM